MTDFDELEFAKSIDTEGYKIFERALPAEFVVRAKQEIAAAIDLEAKYHGTTDYSDFGMVLICSLYGISFTELFDIPIVTKGFNAILGEGCIVYAYTSSSMPPGDSNYSQRIHVDCPRIVPGYMTNMAAMFLLDDFTEDNGATFFMPYSQRRVDPPSKDEFSRSSRRLIAPAGSIFFFDPRLWHSGGQNMTNQWRHAITINMCRPWMKQRIDIPRAMAGKDLSGLSQRALQKLGFFAQVPANYDEYYLPIGERKFRQKAE